MLDPKFRRGRMVLLMVVAGALAPARVGAAAKPPAELSADVCIVGGGSGGFGAAVAAARAGARVIVVERQAALGGTSTRAFVSGWEPGPGNALAREVFQRLQRRGAAGVTSDRNPRRQQGPFGYWIITPQVPYEETLHRAGLFYGDCHGVVFVPEQMSRLMEEMLAETGKCQVLLGTAFTGAEADGDRVRSVRAESGDGRRLTIRARVFIDSSGDVVLCRDLGCEVMVGPEPRSRFQEPAAPEVPAKALNSISLCYRVRKAAGTQPEPSAAATIRKRSAHITAMPDGSMIVNPLGIMSGEVLLGRSPAEVYQECKPIVQAHWNWLRTYPSFAEYEFHDFAPMLGVRESYRVLGRYVLTQNDLMAGLSGQRHDDTIAVADHPMDIHGPQRSTLGQVNQPYGIPYRCLLLPKHQNVLVACRGASFTHLAASSCRLSRTMMALGEAAGLAAAQAAAANLPVDRVDVAAIQRQCLGDRLSAVKTPGASAGKR